MHIPETKTPELGWRDRDTSSQYSEAREFASLVLLWISCYS